MSTVGNPPPTGSSGGTGAYQTMMTAHQQYVSNQQKVVSGQMPASQLAADWQTYLTAAEAWVTSQGGGRSVLPPNEPSASVAGMSGLTNAYLPPSSSGASVPAEPSVPSGSTES